MKKKSAGKTKASVMNSVETGDVAAVRATVANGAGLLDDMEDISPLAIAVENSDAKMVKALLDLGHKPNFGGIIVPLAAAAQNGNKPIVELLLKYGAKPNERGEEGETALMWAASTGHIAIIKRLIAAGANIKQKDCSGEDALDYAVRGGSRKVIKLLLPYCSITRRKSIQRLASLQNETDSRRRSAASRSRGYVSQPSARRKKRGTKSLIDAYESGAHDMLLKLLSEGADPNETDREGTTILGRITSACYGVELIAAFLKAGADPNRGKRSRPLLGAAYNNAKVVQLLLDAGADVNWACPNGGTALMAAAVSGDTESIHLLLSAGANPNAEDSQGHTAYWYALDSNNESAASALEPVTADVDDAKRPWRKNKEGKSRKLCLIDAAQGGDVEYVKQLIDERIRVDVPDENGDTALHSAASNGDLEMIDLLLKTGAPLEAKGSGDYTPLLLAVNRGQTKAAAHLLQAGANLHAMKGTILCLACGSNNSAELIELLIKAGAKVNVVDEYHRQTPLHIAIEHKQTAVARILLDAGASLDSKDPRGWTPFLNAAARLSVEAVQHLIDAGSDIKAVDRQGKNAYDLANEWGKPETAAFLKGLLKIKQRDS